MKGDVNLNESNIKGYFGGKLDEAIKSLKGFIYTVVAFWVTVIGAVVALLLAVSVGSGGDGMFTAMIAAGTVGVIALIALLVIFYSSLSLQHNRSS